MADLLSGDDPASCRKVLRFGVRPERERKVAAFSAAEKERRFRAIVESPQVNIARRPQISSFKGGSTESIRWLVEQLPDDATWDDVMYRLYVRQKIDTGLHDVVNGRTMTTTEVRRRFGLTDEG